MKARIYATPRALRRLAKTIQDKLDSIPDNAENRRAEIEVRSGLSFYCVKPKKHRLLGEPSDISIELKTGVEELRRAALTLDNLLLDELTTIAHSYRQYDDYQDDPMPITDIEAESNFKDAPVRVYEVRDKWDVAKYVEWFAGKCLGIHKKVMPPRKKKKAKKGQLNVQFIHEDTFNGTRRTRKKK